MFLFRVVSLNRSIPSLDCSSVGVLLSDALFTGSPSDNRNDNEDSTAVRVA